MTATYVDADGHILEPTNLWVDGLEPEYQDRAIHLFKEDSGLESWSFSGEKVPFYGDGLSSNVATIGKTKEWRQEHIFEKRDFTWEDGLAMNLGAWDPAGSDQGHGQGEDRQKHPVPYSGTGPRWDRRSETGRRLL